MLKHTFNMSEQINRSANVLFLVLDALRYDVAQSLFQSGELPNFSMYLPTSGWEKRYTPASFTYPAHHAFFSGFLPTRVNQQVTPRRFAAKFKGSESTTAETFLFEEANILTALDNRGYITGCIGGVGFFNQQTEVSKVLPGFFHESFWTKEMGVTNLQSTQVQFELAVKWIHSVDKPFFLYINVSAIHQPNCYYLNMKTDTLESHAAALKYVDSQLPLLMTALKKLLPICCFVCSDHGTAYGEEGHWGHRNGHSTVMEVPYIDFLLES